ncbi:hypothetical protein ACWD62_41365 [Streptomyces sp. NPDC005146]
MRFGTGGIEKIDRVMVLDIRSRRSPRGRTLSDDRCAQRLEKTLEGQVADAAKGNHGGRPKVIDDDMLTVAVALGDKGVPVPEIAKKLVIRTGKNAGKTPRSPRSTGRSPKRRTPRTTACHCGRPKPVRIRRPGAPLTPEEIDLRERLQAQPHPNTEIRR